MEGWRFRKVLSERKRREEICNIHKINNYKQKRRKNLKKAIKETLSNGLSKAQLEELSAIVITFDEVIRLCEFLELSENLVQHCTLRKKVCFMQNL